MSRKFITAVLATAMAITGFAAAPARANDAEALARILGSAATIYVLGSALKGARAEDAPVYVHSEDRNRYNRDDRNRYDRDDRNRYDRDDRNRYDRDDRGRNDRGRYDRARDDRGRYDRGRDGRGRDWDRRSRGLPTACLLRGTNRKGQSQSVLGARCVERNYRNVNRLPDRCRVQMRTDRGVRVVYKTGCLRRNGFELSRR